MRSAWARVRDRSQGDLGLAAGGVHRNRGTVKEKTDVPDCKIVAVAVAYWWWANAGCVRLWGKLRGMTFQVFMSTNMLESFCIKESNRAQDHSKECRVRHR